MRRRITEWPARQACMNIFLFALDRLTKRRINPGFYAATTARLSPSKIKALLKPPLLVLMRLALRYAWLNALALYGLRWAPGLKERLKALKAHNQATALGRPFSLEEMSPHEKWMYKMLREAAATSRRKGRT